MIYKAYRHVINNVINEIIKITVHIFHTDWFKYMLPGSRFISAIDVIHAIRSKRMGQISGDGNI